jgi:hypothetical protein
MQSLFDHTRTVIYLTVAGALWATECIVFARALQFDVIQTTIFGVYFAVLFGAALVFLGRFYGDTSQISDESRAEFSSARLISLAPMLTVILGSFAAFPVMILLVVFGSVL